MEIKCSPAKTVSKRKLLTSRNEKESNIAGCLFHQERERKDVTNAQKREGTISVNNPRGENIYQDENFQKHINFGISLELLNYFSDVNCYVHAWEKSTRYTSLKK